MRDLDNHFGEYSHLAHLPRSAEALLTLRKAASCVKPIMRKRGWRVGRLCEFLPEEPTLWGLNTNHGERIDLRLRHAGDSRQFMDFKEVLDTLLHELVHIVIGPHGDDFHKMWDELREEWETLKRKGYSGEGFLTKGHTVGGQRIPADEVRRRARAAAQLRAKENQKNTLGRVLGGAPVKGWGGRDIRAVIADAATRRQNLQRPNPVTGGCATGTKAGDKASQDALKNGFRTKAEMDDANDIAIAQALADLMEEEEYNNIEASQPSEGLTWTPEGGLQAAPGPPLSHRPQQPRPNTATGETRPTRSPQPPLKPHGRPISRLVLEAESQKQRAPVSKPISTSSRSHGAGSYSSSSRSVQEKWSCLVCTLTNEPGAANCDACEALRPGASPSMCSNPRATAGLPPKPLGWLCRCGAFMENKWWTCSVCGTLRPTS